MKITPILLAVLITTGMLLTSCKQEAQKKQKKEVKTMQNHNQMMRHNMKLEKDNRTALMVSPQKAQHQLQNMRSHVIAVQAILDYLSKDQYDKASQVASSKLGLTDEMKMMCSSFNNKTFEKIGLEFHTNADKMAEIFKTKDKNESLKALALTMNSCVSCHATFKQQISR
jgi:cytochrome c556